MKSIRAFFIRILGLLPAARRESELSAELESHLALHADDLMRAGMSEAEARRSALRHLGGLARTKEAYRERRSLPFLENRLLEVRFALRQMAKNPGITITAVAMVAMGICGSVAIFAFVDAALLKPLPYKDPLHLIDVAERNQVFPRSNLSYFDYLDWKAQNSVFEGFDIYQQNRFMLSTPNGVEEAPAARVSSGFFRTLGVGAVLGRDFREGDDAAGAPRTAMLSYSTWQQRYQGSPDVLSQSVTLDGQSYQIVGVLPQDFHFPPVAAAAYWTPNVADGGCSKRRSCHNFYGVARLKGNVTIEAAFSELSTIAKRLEQQYPDSNRDQGAWVAPLADTIVGEIREILLVLLGGAVLLLLIATVNVANLLLVRAEARTREFAVRNALGASAKRLMTQFLTEGIVLVSLAAALGLGLAMVAVRMLPGLIPADLYAQMSYLHQIGVNARVAGFAGAVSLFAVALFSFTPALRVRLSVIRKDLAEGSRGSAGTGWRRLGSRLVVLELAMAMVLLVGAGLLSKSLYRMLQVDPGLQPERLATIAIVAPRGSYDSDAKSIALAHRVTDRVAGLPGVAEVSIADQMPVTHNGNTTWYRVAGRPHNGEHEEAPQRPVSTEYFRTIGARLLDGRYFTESDDATKPKVVIVNQALATKYFRGESAVGKKLTDLLTPPTLSEIVGVVEDIKEGPLNEATPPTIYQPFLQEPGSRFVVFVRTRQSEGSVIGSLSAAIKEIDPEIVTLRAETMRSHIANSMSVYLNRSSATLVGIFAGIAFLLSVVGLYGVVAYSVSRRNREIGVRIALGARRGNVVELVLKEAAVLALIGVGIGLACSLATTNLLRGLLFGIESWDVATLSGVATTVAGAAMAASYLPARRAASINPVESLRAE